MVALSLALTDEQANWMIQGAASIILASRDAANLPSMAQALGCRNSASRTQGIPAPVFDGLLAMIRGLLSPADMAKLDGAIA